MALTRREKLWLVILLMAVGIASFLAGRLSLIIERLQQEKPVAVVDKAADEVPQGDELGGLIRLGKAAQK